MMSAVTRAAGWTALLPGSPSVGGPGVSCRTTIFRMNVRVSRRAAVPAPVASRLQAAMVTAARAAQGSVRRS
jgi:hypothetical protein